MNTNNKIIFVVGPTAVGKTAFAVLLAKKFDGELISADSRQVYIGMDIGTGKDVEISLENQTSSISCVYRGTACVLPSFLMGQIPLWMLNVVKPDQSFTVDTYQTLAWQVIENIWNRGKTPIVVGGTGLYISSLIRAIETLSIPPNEDFRKKGESMSLIELQDMLARVAPHVYEQLNNSDKHNPRRLIRKIEIAGSNIRLSEKSNKQFDPIMIGLAAPSKILYEKIDERVDDRVRTGIKNEIESLLKQGYSFALSSMNTFGYKEWKEYFGEGKEHDQEEISHIITRWKFDEHGLARRQMTWFRKMKEVQWFDVTDLMWQEKAVEMIREWYTIK